jgi:prepilin-type N-terminal cleavage/methylation domain-containing protein
MNPILKRKSITLIELLIALSIFAVLTLAFTSIDLFSRYHVRTADMRAQLQNEASSALEHMSKNISQAIGDLTNWPAQSTVLGNDRLIIAWLDGNPFAVPAVAANGRRDTDPGNDHRIAYRFTGVAGIDARQIRFCPNCQDNSCSNCSVPWDREIICRRVANFVIPAAGVISTNNISLEITLRRDPSLAASQDNPEVTIRTYIKMPAVSTH